MWVLTFKLTTSPSTFLLQTKKVTIWAKAHWPKKFTAIVSIPIKQGSTKTTMQPKPSYCSSRKTETQPFFLSHTSLGNFIKHLSGTYPMLLLWAKFDNPSRTQTQTPHKDSNFNENIENKTVYFWWKHGNFKQNMDVSVSLYERSSKTKLAKKEMRKEDPNYIVVHTRGSMVLGFYNFLGHWTLSPSLCLSTEQQVPAFGFGKLEFHQSVMYVCILGTICMVLDFYGKFDFGTSTNFVFQFSPH